MCSSGKDQTAKPGSADVIEGTAAMHSPDLASVLAACQALLGNQESQVSLHTHVDTGCLTSHHTCSAVC